MKNIRVIDKVGKKSASAFNHTKVYRVITVEEMVSTASRIEDCKVIIIEELKKSEVDLARKFIEEQVKFGKHILFYVPNVDDVDTTGLADELELEIYMTLEDVHNEIYKLTGVSVSTKVEKREITSSDDDFDEKFETFEEEEPKGGEEEPRGGEEEPSNEEEEPQMEIEETEVKSEEPSSEEEERGLNEKEPQREKEEPKPLWVEETNGFKGLEADEAEEGETIKEEPEVSSITDEEKESLIRDVREANSRILELERLVRIVKNERDDVVKEFQSIVESDELLEDPISLEEYRALNDEIKELQSKGKEISTKKEELELELESAKAENLRQTEKVRELHEKVDRLNSELEESGVREEEVQKRAEEIKSLNNTIDDLNERIEDMNRELSKCKDSLEDYQAMNLETEAKMDEESEARMELLRVTGKIANALTSNVKEKEYYRVKVEELVNENEELRADSGNGIDEKVVKLNSKVEELEGEIEKQKGLVDREKRVREEAESKYKKLMEDIGGDKGNVDKLNETNETLKAVNEQYSERIEELERSKKEIEEENIRLSTSYSSLEDMNDQLKVNLQKMSGISSSKGGFEMGRLDYSGKAKIVNVFSNGSYGVTTMAMSILLQLSRNGRKAILVELDTSNPSIAEWAQKAPYIKGKEGEGIQGKQATGIGVLTFKGMKTFERVSETIEKASYRGVTPFEYVTGLYCKASDEELASMQLGELFNYLGDKYEYIVVDCGKVGQSVTKDSIVREVARVSNKNICMARTSVAVKVSRTLATLKECGIDEEFNVEIVMNMCKSSGVSENTKKVLAHNQSEMIVTIQKLLSSQEIFTADQTSGVVVQSIINSI